MTAKFIVTTVQGEVLTHRVLWVACQRQLKVAKTEENGSWYFFMAAMLMAFMCFEAYINYLGAKLAPELWQNERDTFRKAPYKGTSGKLLKLCELFEVPFPNKGSRPYQSIRILNQLRDLLAHGKLEEFEFTVKHSPDKNPAVIKFNLDDYISAEKAEICIGDVKQLAESLNSAFLDKIGYDLIHSTAFDGILGYSSGNQNI